MEKQLKPKPIQEIQSLGLWLYGKLRQATEMQEIHFDNRTFSRYPAGRYRTDGKWSGEKFRDEILSHFIANGEKTTIFLDEAQGFGSSFLEEAFGGLIRKGITFATFQSLVSLRSDDSSLLEEIETYMLDAQGE